MLFIGVTTLSSHARLQRLASLHGDSQHLDTHSSCCCSNACVVRIAQHSQATSSMFCRRVREIPLFWNRDPLPSPHERRINVLDPVIRVEAKGRLIISASRELWRTEPKKKDVWLKSGGDLLISPRCHFTLFGYLAHFARVTSGPSYRRADVPYQ